MATEPEGGAVTEPTEPVPEPQKKEVQESQIPDELKERFETLESKLTDATTQIENAQQTIGKQGDELGSLRNENAYLKGGAQQLSQGMQQHGQQQPAQYPQTDVGSTEEDFDTLDPKAVERRMDAKIATYDQKRQAEYAQAQARAAEQSYYQGRQQAVKEKPELYKGKESEIDNLVKGFYMTTQGGQYAVTPAQLADPQTWHNAAALLRFRENDFNVTSPASMVNPVSPTPGEIPTAVKPKPGEEPTPVDLGSTGRGIASGLGLTEEDAKKIIRDERDEEAWRNK